MDELKTFEKGKYYVFRHSTKECAETEFNDMGLMDFLLKQQPLRCQGVGEATLWNGSQGIKFEGHRAWSISREDFDEYENLSDYIHKQTNTKYNISGFFNDKTEAIAILNEYVIECEDKSDWNTMVALYKLLGYSFRNPFKGDIFFPCLLYHHNKEVFVYKAEEYEHVQYKLSLHGKIPSNFIVFSSIDKSVSGLIVRLTIQKRSKQLGQKEISTPTKTLLNSQHGITPTNYIGAGCTNQDWCIDFRSLHACQNLPRKLLFNGTTKYNRLDFDGVGDLNYGDLDSCFNKINGVQKMTDITKFKKDNLAEAKKQADKERNEIEVREAKIKYVELIDLRDSFEREIKETQERLAEVNKELKLFENKK